MNIRPINSKADYERGLAELQRLWHARPGTPEADRREVLAVLLEAYEKRVHPLPPPDPIDAIQFRMEQEGLTRKDLLSIFGTTARASEVLTRKRPLSLEMIRKLHYRLGIPLESLITKPSGRRRSAALAR
jgi:HTH-type transcriptional regulator/antitoxin HigA